MKKSLVVLLLLLVLVTSLMFTSCTFFRENEERVSNAVLADVTYDYDGNEYFPKQTLTLQVTRSELVSYINYVIYLYSSYNMEYDTTEVFESSIDSLITQKYQILEGMAYLMNNASSERRAAMYYFTDDYDALYGDKIIPEGMLTVAERLSTVASTNESFITSIDQYVTEYYDEIRELKMTTVKENITAHYTAGYSVDDTDADNDGNADGVKIAYLNEDGETYSEGLYLSSVSSDEATSIDHTKVFLKITLVKSGEENYIAYMPLSENTITSVDDEENVSDNIHITNKIASVSYEEPVVTTEEVTDEKTGETTEEEVTSYTTHTAIANYKLITPRTSFAEKTEESEQTETTTEEEPDPLDAYRYMTTFNMEDADQKTFFDEGQLFNIAPTGIDDATRDAYRQFREAKKSALIGFTTEADAYNGLGYYYKSSFESAVLTAVQFELKQAALTVDPVTDSDIEEQYSIMAAKQKEEYDILSYKDQVDKFATTIATDLSTCYYVPLDALKNTTYTYTDSLGVEQTRAYATKNVDDTYTIDMFYIAHILFKYDQAIQTIIDRVITKDLTDEDEIKAAKLNYILSVGMLSTNKSKETYNEESGNDLSEAYYVVLDNEGNPTLYDGEGNALSLEDQFLEESVKLVYTNLTNELSTAISNDERLTIFKKYMTWYNDDSGSMSSKLGYFVGMGDIEHSYDGNDFPDTAKELYIDYMLDGVFDNGSTGNAFTSYGLHVEMLSFLPFYQINLTELDSGLWVLGIDAKLDLEDSSFREALEKSVEDTINTETYSAWTTAITSEEATEHATRFDKKINKLAKTLGVTR